MWHALTSFVSAAHSIAERLSVDIPLLPAKQPHGCIHSEGANQVYQASCTTAVRHGACIVLEHHALVATEAYLARSDAGITLLHILLPNNPEVKSHAKLVYDPPQHALPYIEQAFTALVRFADSMTQRLLSTPLDPQAYVIAPNRYAFKAPRLFQPIPSLAELSARIKQSAQA